MMTFAKEQRIEAAVDIARLFVRDAVRSEGRCFWMTETMSSHSHGEVPDVVACDSSVTHGIAGVCQFLARVHRVCPDPRFRDTIDDACRTLEHSSQTQRIEGDDLRLTLADIQRYLDNKTADVDTQLPSRCGIDPSRSEALTITHINDELRKAIAQPQYHPCFFDPQLANAALRQRESDEATAWCDIVDAIANHILNRTNEFGQPWTGSILAEYPPIGIVDGLAGIGLFLLHA